MLHWKSLFQPLKDSAMWVLFMIIIKQIAFGNSSEAYIQSGFTNGLNIISSSENHVGKTLIMQAMMYALGSVPMFPASFPAEDYVF